MRIVHFSDWHGQYTKLPEATLYICTGDMLPNFEFVWDDRDLRKEQLAQRRWVNRWAVKTGGFPELLGSPRAPVIVVKGNHDFIPLAPLFVGCDVHELVNNEVIEVLGLRVTGHRGVPTINGCWADETPPQDLLDKVRAMDPGCDVYVTHYPPSGVGLDLPGNWGLVGMENWFQYQTGNMFSSASLDGDALHCFGHIHECGGKVVTRDRFTFSNAAEAMNVLEGSPSDGWKLVVL